MKSITNTIDAAFALSALGCFALLPAAHALLPPPPPDGGYIGYNTAEGDGALFSLTTGTSNALGRAPAERRTSKSQRIIRR